MLNSLRGLAQQNPLIFVLVILGALLVIGWLFGIAILVGTLFVVLLYFFFPVVILLVGLFYLAKGRMVLGGVLVLSSIILWGIKISGAAG